MTTVTLDQLKAQTNALDDDMELLMLYADSAEEQVEIDTNCTLEELQKPDGSYPKKLTAAVLMLVGHWYRNREAFSTQELKEVPKTYNTLIASFRDYSKQYR